MEEFVETASTTARRESAFPGYEPPAASQSQIQQPAAPVWALWQRVLFRFFFVYLLLQIGPWDFFRAVPGVPFVLRWYDSATDWAVRASNAHLFHVRDTLIPMNGSGDT